MIRRSMTLTLALVAGLTASAMGQVDPAAKEKLEKAVAAIKAAEGLSFTGKVYATGSMMADVAPSTEGNVLMRRTDEGWEMRATGKGRANAKDTDRAFDVLWTPQHMRFVDPEKKQVVQRPTRGGVSVFVRPADPLRIKELLDREPFAKELKYQNISFGPPADAGGTACEVIIASQATGPSERIYLGATDSLPRKLERVYASKVEGSFVVELNNLEARQITDAELTIPVPDGFTEEVVQGAKPRTPATEAPGGVATETAPKGVEAVQLPAAPAFELMDQHGNKVSLASLSGKVALLDFWGTWCLPCRASHKELQDLANQFKGQDVRVLSIAVNEKSRQAPIDYMQKHGYTFELLLDGDQAAKDYGVKAYPTFVVVGRDGRVLQRADGYERDKTVPALAESIRQGLAIAPATETGASTSAGGGN